MSKYNGLPPIARTLALVANVCARHDPTNGCNGSDDSSEKLPNVIDLYEPGHKSRDLPIFTPSSTRKQFSEK